jgi:hypothetical protein
MKTKQIYTQSRRSGKTTKIIKKFITDWENQNTNSIIVVPNIDMKKSITEKILKQLNHITHSSIISKIFTPNSSDGLRGQKIDTVYVDDALSCDKQKLWYACTHVLYDCNIICYTTPDRIYKHEKIELTKILKRNPNMRKYINEHVLQEIDEYYCENILTEDFEIIAPSTEGLSKKQLKIDHFNRIL